MKYNLFGSWFHTGLLYAIANWEVEGFVFFEPDYSIAHVGVLIANTILLLMENKKQ